MTTTHTAPAAGPSTWAETRAAAPFAILDAVYSGMLLILAEDPPVEFEPLELSVQAGV